MQIFIDLLTNEGTSATVPAKLAALCLGIVAAAVTAALILGAHWIYRRLHVSH